MAWVNLPTDYADAVWDGLKKYVQIDNSDGTVSFRDVTAYIQREKSFFGASDANAMNAGMNELAGELGGVDEKVAQIINTYLSNTFFNNAGAHNAIYRGKNLGTSVTAAQWAAIKAGTFEDMYIGDYWEIGGVVYRIAAFNYYYNTGDTACIKNHITLVPDATMYNYVMNDNNTTTGAYVSSKMYTQGLTQAKTTINSAFGEAHILNHRQYLQNAVTDGYASGASWYNSTVELMTEQNVYGGQVFGNQLNGTVLPNSFVIDKSQYPLFTFRPDMQSTSQWFWLRDVVSAFAFAVVNDYGNSHHSSANSDRGVRPAFSIYQS